MPLSLKVDFLGGYRLSYQTGQLPRTSALIVPPTIKSQSLLAFLIIQRDHIQRREHLMDMFWSDAPSHKARRSLSTALWHIRRCFPNQDPIQGNSRTIQFIFDGHVKVDTEEFEKQVVQGTFFDLQEAVSLYKGDFLDGFYDDWVINERYRLQTLFIEALSNLMTLQETNGDHRDALQSAQRLLKTDSLREDAHRLLMRIYCAVGQRNTALEQYHLCRQILRDELNIAPSAETNRLFQDIQSGQYEIGQASSPEILNDTTGPVPIARSPLDITARKILVGRDQELAALDKQWMAVQTGQGEKMILISGEAGLGKTRLLETFAEKLSTQGTRILWGCCYEFERLLPYQPFAEALRPSVTKLAPEDRKRLPEWVLLELRKLLPEMKTPQFRNDEHPSTNADQEQARLFSGVYQFLSKLSDSTPLLFVLEDLHWATDSTLELLHYLARHLASASDGDQEKHSILLVGSYRPELIKTQHSLKAFQRRLQMNSVAASLNISSLSTSDVNHILCEMSGQNEAILPLAKRLYHETEGNPFYLMEIIKALFEMEAITLEEGTWKVDFDRVSHEELPLPASVSEVILARVHRMKETTQDVMRIAAILGREFDFNILVAVHAQDEDAVLSALDEMLRFQVIEEGAGISDRDYAFSHHKFQEVIYADILRQQRQKIHARVGMAIEEHFGSRLGEVINELAHHYLQAQYLDQSLTGKAIQYLQQAGNMAAKQFACEDAIDYYNTALKLVSESDPITRYTLLLAREQIYDVQGNRDDQKDDLEKLWELAQILGTKQQAEVMLCQARYARETGNYSSAAEAAQSAINLALSTQRMLASEGYTILGHALLRQGDYRSAQSSCKQGVALARKESARWLEAYGLNGLGLTHHYLGDPLKAQQYLEEAVQIYSQIHDMRGWGAALTNLGVIANEQGNNFSAMSYYQDALGIHQKAGNRKGEGLVLGNLGVIAAAQGNYMQARQDLLHALTIAREIGHRLYEGNALLNLGNVCLYLGAHVEASERYEAALDVYRQIGNKTGLGWGLAYLSLLDNRLENHEAALKYAQEALYIAEEIGDRHIQGYTQTHLGHALLGMEHCEDSIRAYEKAVTLRRELDEQHLAIESLSGLLRTDLALNRSVKAVTHLEEILNFLEQDSLEGTDEPLRVYLSCYQILSANGDARARQLLITAHSILLEQAERIDDHTLRRTFLENVPAHKVIVTAFAGGKFSD